MCKKEPEQPNSPEQILMLTTEEPSPESTYRYYYAGGIPKAAEGYPNVFSCEAKAANPFSESHHEMGFAPERTLVIAADQETALRYRRLGYAVILQQEDLTAAGSVDTELTYVIDYPCDMTDDFFCRCFCRQRVLPVRIAVTERLLLREITEEDVPALYDLYEDELSRRFMEPPYPYEEELAYTRDYIRHQYGFYDYGLWVVIDRTSGRLIGRAGISQREINGEERKELGYILHRDYRGRGLATEACLAVLQEAVRLGIDELFLVTDRANESSLRLASRLGFSEWGEAGRMRILQRPLSQQNSGSEVSLEIF